MDRVSNIAINLMALVFTVIIPYALTFFVIADLGENAVPGAIGGNNFTNPVYPRPGDTVTIDLGYMSMGLNPRILTEKGFSIKLEPLSTINGVPKMWGTIISTDKGSQRTANQDYVQYKVNPLTGKKLSGPYAVMEGVYRIPSVKVKINSDLDMRRNQPVPVTFSVIINENDPIEVKLNIVPNNSHLHIYGKIIQVTIPVIIIILVGLFLFVVKDRVESMATEDRKIVYIVFGALCVFLIMLAYSYWGDS